MNIAHTQYAPSKRDYGQALWLDTSDIPLSYGQESLWLLDKMSQPGAAAYNEAFAFRIEGDLHIAALQRSLHRVVERHEALRTLFVETKTGLKGMIQDQVEEFMEVVDIRGMDSENSNGRIEQLIIDSYSRPFDLRAGPLLRAMVIRVADDESIFALTIHHIATDGWSMGIIFDEIYKNYVSLCHSNRYADLPPVDTQYKDYALGLRQSYEQGAFAKKIEYWKQTLARAPELLKLPVDYSRPPVQTFNGSTYTIRVPKEKIKALVNRCHRECGSTEFMVLLSVYAVLLSRYTGQDTLTIGTTILNRNHYNFLNVVGCFVNTTALLLDLDGTMTFRELLNQVAERTLEMLDHQDAPYPKVLENLAIQRDPSYNPIFQTMLTLLGKKKVLKLGDSVTCQPFPFKRVGAKFELLVTVSEEEDHIEFQAEFNTDLFHIDTIERMMHHYEHLIERLAADIDAQISRVPFLFAAEKDLILNSWNNTYIDYPRTTVIDMIESQAQKTPEAIAVEFNDRSLTYGALNRVANQVAHFLIRKQPTESVPFIGVYMERSLEMVVALLAIVKAGCAYVPIDPEYPNDRIRFMIDDAELPLILTQEKYRSVLQDLNAEIIVLSDLEQFRLEEAGNTVRHLLPDSNVYMIYTSGSTGKPKGVINRHVSLFNRLYWMQSLYGLTPDDRVLQKTPFSFDVSVWEFFWPLMFGARIVMAEPGGHRDADYLKQLILDKQVTTLHFVPSMLNVFLEEEGIEFCCTSLRRVFCSGEALTYQTVRKFFEKIPCDLHNLYGPTEAAIDVSYWPCSLDYPGSIVPIGKPIANIQLYVLDKHMQIQPIGVAGELWIGGIGLAKGYHKREELTRKCFIEDPFTRHPEARLYKTGDLARYLPDGNIEYLGRIDNQVKLRGFRIELGEIEAAVRGLPSVKDAVVIVHETKNSKVLVAYVVALDGFEQQSAKILLRKQLPDFMVPQIFVEIASMPMSVNGKLERRALPDPLAATQQHDQVTQAVSKEEEILISIWKNVFGVDQIGIESNFFKLGGDSILSIRIAAQLRELGYAVEVHDIFTHLTIRQLAQHITTRRTAVKGFVETPFCLIEAKDKEKLPPDVEDAWPLTMLQSGMIYHTMIQEKTPVYHDIFSFDIETQVHAGYLFEAFELLISRHPQLRSAFDLNTFEQPLQVVYSDVVVPLEITDITHLPRLEQDQVIQQWIEAEKQHDFDLERAPLLRIQVHVRSKEELNLTIAFHHVVLDGWSFALLLNEFRHVYTDLLQQRPVRLAQEQVLYSHYVGLEQQALSDTTQSAFWLDKIAGLSFSPLPRPNPESAVKQPGTLASVEKAIPGQVVATLQTLAGDLNVPLKSVFLAMHLRVLGCLVNRKAIVSGLVCNGRPEVRGGEELVGLFLNTIPFPIQLMQEGWRSFIKRVFKLEQDVVEYRRFPVAEIQKRNHNQPLFDTLFNYTDFHVHGGGYENSAVKIVRAHYFEQTNYDAVVHVHRDYFTQEMRLIFNYDASRLEDNLIARYMNHYLEAIIDLASNPNDIPQYLHIDDIASAEDLELSLQSTDAALTTASYTAPRNALEKQIAEILAQAIGIESIGIDDNYLELGVDSITAIRIVAKIKKLGVKLALQDLFTCQTIRKIAEYIGTKQGETAAVTRVQPFELIGNADRTFAPSIIDAYPATSMQLDMIHRSEADIQQAVYHDIFSYRLALPLHEELLEDCLSRGINRHDTFRTAFALHGYSVPLQLVFDNVQPHLEVFDVSTLSDEHQKHLFDEWFEGEKRNGFDWTKPGLVRFYIHKWNETDFSLTLSFHHSIIDGWSLSLFINQLIKEYIVLLEHRDIQDPVLPVLKYRDYVKVELDSRNSPVSRSFWQDQLKHYTYNALPRRPHGDNRSSRWSETKIILDEARLEALTRLSNSLSVPLKHTMLACHLKVMSLICQETDVLTGVFTNGRLEEEEGDSVLGLFLNFMPFRQKLEDQTWQQFIKETFQNECQCLPYRRYPLGCVRQDVQQERIFETVFNYTHFKSYGDIAYIDKQNRQHKVLKDVRWFEHTDFLLLTNVGYDVHQTQLIITLDADGKVVIQQDLEIIGELYRAILDRMILHPEAEVGEMDEGITNLVAMLSR